MFLSIVIFFFQMKEVLFWILVATISIILLYIIFKNIYHPSSITFVIFVIFSLAFASTWYTMYMVRKIYIMALFIILFLLQFVDVLE